MINETYLLYHSSYELHTFARRYSSDMQLLESFCARPTFFDEPYASEILDYIKKSNRVYSTPVLFSANNQMIYALIPAQKDFFLIGPVRFYDLLYLKHQSTISPINADFLDTVAVLDFHKTVTLILLIYNLYQVNFYGESELLLENCIQPDAEDEFFKQYSDQVFDNLEHGRIHNPYDQEVREFASIENGDLEQLKRSLAEDYPGEIGTLAKDLLRHTRNRAIVVITLASRAAMKAGIIPEISYSLSDSYIQKVEECNDIPSLFHLFHSAEFQYAQMVKEMKEQKAGEAPVPSNSYITKCKDYVYAHLHDKISVKEIADELHINANYLSTLFHKCEHISLTDFIRKHKIQLAQNLLIYSQYSYIEIATYLGFSSQSHLGKIFKQTTGYTLRKYRETFGMKEFMK